MFKDYYYLFSVNAALVRHFETLAKKLASAQFVVDVGSNDGILLRPLRELGVKAIGIEPSVNVSGSRMTRGWRRSAFSSTWTRWPSRPPLLLKADNFGQTAVMMAPYSSWQFKVACDHQSILIVGGCKGRGDRERTNLRRPSGQSRRLASIC
jgi:hypothetical protein